MFVETWRKHWGLTQDPFACEDADKDQILSRMDTEAVHSGFDRLFGDPQSPAPGIVFGEKGSGKSGLRLTMKRRIRDYNESSSEGKVFCSEYNDFDVFLEHFRRAVGAKGEPSEVADKMMREWTTSDHLDAMLSLGVTELIDQVLDGRLKMKALNRKQRVDLLLLGALYYDSHQRSTEDALGRLRSVVRVGTGRVVLAKIGRGLLSIVGAALIALPFVGPAFDMEVSGSWMLWGLPGAAILTAVWGTSLWKSAQRGKQALGAARSIRVLQRDPSPLRFLLECIPADLCGEFVLPKGADEATRYDYLTRFNEILGVAGFRCWYVLFDRVDEPSLLNVENGNPGRRFVEALLDHKLLQLSGLALKAFLPIELDEIYRNASPQELKRMRLEKSNLVEKLDWTGQELYEIATRRLRSCTVDGARANSLGDLFAEEFDHQHLRQTLETLATPRYALGFLASVMREYARNMPDDLQEDSDDWFITRSHFDVVRTGWVDRAEIMRRKLNT
ncbi:MAG: hypothetical protein ACI8QS_000783 [Planctomycetota bacterium]|jgi:hypothetical protein